MHFSMHAALIFFSPIYGRKIDNKTGVLKPPGLFQGKELQVTHFKVMCLRVGDRPLIIPFPSESEI